MKSDDLARLDNILKDYRHHYHIIGSSDETDSNPSVRGKERVRSSSSLHDTPKMLAPAKHRSRMDIASVMLKAARRGALKSKIAAEAYLSRPHLNEYIDLLVENGMLHYSPSVRRCYTTHKGQKLLEMYHQSRQIFYQKW
jgi:predicted transcriptional regulator